MVIQHTARLQVILRQLGLLLIIKGSVILLIIIFWYIGLMQTKKQVEKFVLHFESVELE